MRITVHHLTEELKNILISNAPVRGENIPAGHFTEKQLANYMQATRSSPVPGNLKTSGLIVEEGVKRSRVVVGGERAAYAEYTERGSFRKGWMAKSQQDFLNMLKQVGGKIK